MPSIQIHVFISHSWKYSSHYEKLASWIFSERWHVDHYDLDFRDFSVPRDDPIHNASSETALEVAIFNQIMRSHVVVMPMGMYVNYSKWIQKEINGANKFSKPILAVNPWQQERKSSIVRFHATEEAGWNSKSVVEKVWRLYNAR
jgi:hypothetical protein